MKRLTLIIAILLSVSIDSSAKDSSTSNDCSTPLCIPADPRPRTITQPNGKKLTFYIKGDERISWAETLDGYTLLNGDSNVLEYACIDENLNLIASGIMACNEDERDEWEKEFLKDLPKNLFFSKQQTDAAFHRFSTPVQSNNQSKE